jgi:hypothetical protein
MVVTGLGVLPLLGVARTWRQLFARTGLAYLCGLVVVGIVSAHLALVHVGVGWVGLVVIAAASAALGAWRLRGSEGPQWSRPALVSLAGIGALLGVLVEFGRAFAVAPLDRYDAWAIWALKGRALYSFGWADPAVFAGHEYRFANLDYPLWLPSLEALDFRTMGAFDTRLLHVQFLLFLAAALAALHALLRDRVPAFVLWPSLLAIALAPAVFDQLLTAYADVPLALIFAVGVASFGRWLVAGERWALAVGTLCFAGALLTKNEGSLFVAAAFVALFAVASRRRRVLAFAAAVDVLLLVPWKAYTWIHGLHDINYSLSDTFDVHHVGGRLGVGPIAFRTLGGQMFDPLQWGLLVPLFAMLAAAALLVGLRALPLYGLAWTIVSWLGLSWIYVVSHFEYSVYLGSTKERVIASIVLGSGALVPLLAAEVWSRAAPAPRIGSGSSRPRSGGG